MQCVDLTLCLHMEGMVVDIYIYIYIHLFIHIFIFHHVISLSEGSSSPII